MNSLVLRAVDYTTPLDWVYKSVPKRLCYLRDIVEGTAQDQTFTPWQRLKGIQEYMPLVYSDMYRSPLGSAKAYEEKTGVQKPGYSGHNFGVSIDLAIDATIKRHNITYNKLVNTLIAWGWTPYQGVTKDANYKRGKEDWHFNFVGDYGYRPWESGSPAGGQQAISWIKDNVKFTKDITDMLQKLGYGTLQQFKVNHLPAKLQAHSTDEEVVIRMLNIYTCKILDTDGNIIPG